MLQGSMQISERMSERISSSVPTASTRPADSLWNFGEAVSHFWTVLPGIALGEFTNSFAFFSSINVKSVSAASAARPPPQLPKIAVIWGTTPEAIVCFR